MVIKLFFLFLSLMTCDSFAAVWQDNATWDIQFENEFSNWMSSDSVHEKFFVDVESPYYGINADCADTAYALRAIFAYEHSLPFVINNPSGSRRGKKMSNQMGAWDNITNTNKRVVAFINEVSESVGTFNLSHLDTYPIGLNYINPGTLFTLSAKTKTNRQIHHTYNIKNINPNGTFDVIYGSQAGEVYKLPLTRRLDREFDNLPNNPWGFRKFRWPEYLSSNLSEFPRELGASMEQFKLAKDLGKINFFKYLKKLIAKSPELPNERMTRLFNSLCEESKARITYVNQGLDYLKKIKYRCMNFREFDTFSTPARDDLLIDTFTRTQTAYEEIRSDGELSNVNPELVEFSLILFDKEQKSRLRLLEFCPINYRDDISIDLATLWSRLDNNIFSSHPNDTIEVRWGEKTSPQTTCEHWY